MNTSHMNERITFFKYATEQNEDGELISGIEKDIFSCWAEVSKSTIKEFKERTNQDTGQGIQKRKASKTFLIRHRYEEIVDTNMLVKFKGAVYEVKDVELDYRNKDFDLVSVEAKS